MDPNFIAKFVWTRLRLQKHRRYILTPAKLLHLTKKDVQGMKEISKESFDFTKKYLHLRLFFQVWWSSL